MTAGRRSWVLGGILAVCWCNQAFSDRQLVTDQRLTAWVADDFSCAQQVSVTVRGQDAKAFSGNRIDLQKLIGGLRSALAFECPEAREIWIKGEVGGAPVYSGLVSQAQQWKLVDVEPAPEQSKQPPASVSTAAPAKQDDIARCDTLAAHPDDPQKVAGVAGVPDEGLNVERALDACLAAVEADPDEPRLNFQLGRVLRAADRDEDAAGFLAQAAAAGHPGALAYLGDMSDDTEERIAFYKAASEAGFGPAAVALESAEDGSASEETGSAGEESCDRLAAHPDDPSIPHGVKGVTEDDLDPEAAADACMELAERNPDPRYKFQLGRALYAAQMYSEAAEYLGQAARDGHAGAKAYLADLYQEGYGVRADSDRARELYEQASKAGFQPAGEVLASLVTAPNQMSAPKGFDPKDFQAAALAKALYDGDFKTLDQFKGGFLGEDHGMPIGLTTYLTSLVATLDQPDVCPNLLGNGVASLLESWNAQLAATPSVAVGATKAGMAEVLDALLDPMGQGGSNFVKGTLQGEDVKNKLEEQGVSDAMTIWAKYSLDLETPSCDSAAAKRFAKNVGNYIRRGPSPASAALLESAQPGPELGCSPVLLRSLPYSRERSLQEDKCREAAEEKEGEMLRKQGKPKEYANPTLKGMIRDAPNDIAASDKKYLQPGYPIWIGNMQINYGPVPDDFVPKIPPVAVVANSEAQFSMRLEKHKPGLLTEILLSKTLLDVVWSGTNVDRRDDILDEQKSLRQSEQVLLACSYRNIYINKRRERVERRRTIGFFYRNILPRYQPPALQARLRPDHILFEVGPALDTCPGQEQEADMLNKRKGEVIRLGG